MYVLVDAQTGGRYVDVEYPTQRGAIDARRDLLRGYPADHEWRKRLVVREVGAAKPKTKSGGRKKQCTSLD